MELRIVEIREVSWTRGEPARFWYVQPRTELPHGAPIVPRRNGKTPALRLLESTLEAEKAFPEPKDAPTFIMLPEFAIHPEEAATAVQVGRRARPNTVVVFGLGHLTEAQARALEPDADLWEGPSEGRLTNCAAVVLGGGGPVYLQPKIVRSRWEQNGHWPGRVVRYFEAKNLQFIVIICSELLDRPNGATTARAIVDDLEERGRQLNLVIWIQHNPRPRSAEFSTSIEQFWRLRSTVVVVGSRVERSTSRVNNYAVCGAIVPQDALAAHFDLLTKRFHYVEPVPSEAALSRVVLLRYDADVYRVHTVLARWIEANVRTAKGALFEESQPYVLDGEALTPSAAHFHIEDICARAGRIATALAPDLADATRQILDQLAGLTTTEFLAVLDVGVLPRPAPDDERHVAGAAHLGGDFRCRCWRHRECVDRLADEDEAAEPVAQVILALAALPARGVPVRIAYDASTRTNVVARLGDVQLPIGVVFPFDFDAEGTEVALWGRKRAALVDSAYIVLGVGERAVRPRTSSIDAALARPIGVLRVGTSAAPMLKAVYSAEFWNGVAEGRIRQVLEERFIPTR